MGGKHKKSRANGAKKTTTLERGGVCFRPKAAGIHRVRPSGGGDGEATKGCGKEKRKKKGQKAAGGHRNAAGQEFDGHGK